jgi:hypothetical protein
MIIVEGPDGAGKTTLIQELKKSNPQLEVAPRVVSKDTQALVNLRDWVDANLAKGFQPSTIYDRHRLISDPIYRFKIPGKSMDEDFYEPKWLATAHLQLRAIAPILIFCLPPLQTVLSNLEDDEENSAVTDHIVPIYFDYVASMARYLADPKFSTFVYDYTKTGSLRFIQYGVAATLVAREAERSRLNNIFKEN